MRLTNFKIESLGYENFEGFTKNEDWNGWDCPYFTLEQAQEILKSYNTLRSVIEQKETAYYDSTKDAFIFPTDDENESEIFTAIIEKGQKYYPIGAFCWIWEENLMLDSFQ